MTVRAELDCGHIVKGDRPTVAGGKVRCDDCGALRSVVTATLFRGSSHPGGEDSKVKGTGRGAAESSTPAGSSAPHGKTHSEPDSDGTRTGGAVTPERTRCTAAVCFCPDHRGDLERDRLMGYAPPAAAPACAACSTPLNLRGGPARGQPWYGVCPSEGCREFGVVVPQGALPPPYLPRSLAEEALLSDGDHLDPRLGGAVLAPSCGSPSVVACDGLCDDCAHQPGTLPAARVCVACEKDPAAEGADICDGCNLARQVMRGEGLPPDFVQLHATITGRHIKPKNRKQRSNWEVQVSIPFGIVGRAKAPGLAEAVSDAAHAAVRAWSDSKAGRKAVRRG